MLIMITRQDELYLGWGNAISLVKRYPDEKLKTVSTTGYMPVVVDSDREDLGCLLTKEFQPALLKYLLEQYGLVTTTSLDSWVNYTINLSHVIRQSSKVRLRSLEAFIDEEELLSRLGSAKMVGSFTDSPIYNTDQTEVEGVVYFIGVPSMLLHEMWIKCTSSAPIEMHMLLDDDTTFSMDLASREQVSCSRYESLLDLGCVGCPSRLSCTGTLLGENLEVRIPTLKQLTKIIKSCDWATSVPHSLAEKVGHYLWNNTNRKVHLSRLTLKNIDEAWNLHKTKLERRRERASFYNSECKSCAFKDICGTDKALSYSGKGVSDFCSGKVSTPTLITEHNWEGYALALIAISLGLYRGSYASSLPDLSEENQALIAKCMALATEWVNSESKVPGYVRVAEKSGLDIFVVPKVLCDISDTLGYRGGFAQWNWERSYGCPVGDWYNDATVEVAKSINYRKPISEWRAITYSGLIVSSKYFWQKEALTNGLDPKLLIHLLGIEGSSRSKKISKEDKISVLIKYLCTMIVPRYGLRYGSFGSKKCQVPCTYNRENLSGSNLSLERLFKEAIRNCLGAFIDQRNTLRGSLGAYVLVNNYLKELK